MATLYPFLLMQIVDGGSIPQVESITCWTLSRYVDWAVEQTASGVQPNLIGIMTGLESLMTQKIYLDYQTELISLLFKMEVDVL